MEEKTISIHRDKEDTDFNLWLSEYYDKFGDYFPTENYACSIEEMIEKIKCCIATGEQVKERKDVIY